MKRWLLYWMLGTSMLASKGLQAQTHAVDQLLLNVQKLEQLKKNLTKMKERTGILAQRLTEIQVLSAENYLLHKRHLEGLLAVNPAIGQHTMVTDMLATQVLLVQEYQQASARFNEHGSFNAAESGYLARVYGKLFTQSMQDLDELHLLISPGKLRMSDVQRLQGIQQLSTSMQDKLSFLRWFNNQTSLLLRERTKEKNESIRIQNLHGLHNETIQD